MPRKLRVECPGAIYHVMSRGDRREGIFQDDVDRQDFLKTLAETCQKTDFQVHAYCLMGNHFHLVVETSGANLVAGMCWLLSTAFGWRRGGCRRWMRIEELKRQGWSEGQWRQSRKSDPVKLAVAARLTRETILTVGPIAKRLEMGTRQSVTTRLQEQ